MGQQDIYNFLRKEYNKNPDEWFTARDISKKLKVGNSSVVRSLKPLRNSSQIMFKEVWNRYVYKYKGGKHDKL